MRILILFLILFSFNSFACRNQVPESEAKRYHTAALLGESVAAQFSCKDKPDEACLCFDHCESWKVCEVVEETITPEVGEPYTQPKLVNNLELMAAELATKAVEENHREIAQARKAEALECIRGMDLDSELDSAANVASLRGKTKTILKCMIGVLR